MCYQCLNGRFPRIARNFVLSYPPPPILIVDIKHGHGECVHARTDRTIVSNVLVCVCVEEYICYQSGYVRVVTSALIMDQVICYYVNSNDIVHTKRIMLHK